MKQYYLIIVTIIGATLGAPHKGRIYGGQPAAPGQYPSIVLINRDSHFCDGSIINKNWVVTSAGCLRDVTSTTTILSGSNLASSGGAIHNVVDWFSNEYYNDAMLINDIGLIQIEGEFEFDDLTQPTDFIDPPANSNCSVAGWGKTDTVDFSEKLQFIQQVIGSTQSCWNYIGSNYVNEQICAFGGLGQGTCNGDFGGPLVCDGKLAGISSFILEGCGLGYPGFYTRVSAYASWIEQKNTVEINLLFCNYEINLKHKNSFHLNTII